MAWSHEVLMQSLWDARDPTRHNYMFMLMRLDPRVKLRFLNHKKRDKLFPAGWIPQYLQHVAEQWTSVTDLPQSRISRPLGKTTHSWQNRESPRWLMLLLLVLTSVQDIVPFIFYFIYVFILNYTCLYTGALSVRTDCESSTICNPPGKPTNTWDLRT